MVNELRLNNWISVQFDQRKEIQVTVTNIEQLVNHGPEMLMRGIPINEEWLIKFGFNKKEKTNLYLISIHKFDLKKLCVYLDEKDCTIAMVDYFSNSERTELFPLNYQYVHQLQNLFYCLVGKELIIVNK